jgi:hypothetical protein
MSDKKRPKYNACKTEEDGKISDDREKQMPVWENISKKGNPYLVFTAKEDIKAGSKVFMFPNKPRDEQEPEW